MKKPPNDKPNLWLRKWVKFAYSKVEFQNFSGDDSRTPTYREGKGRGYGGEGWKGFKGLAPEGKSCLRP